MGERVHDELNVMVTGNITLTYYGLPPKDISYIQREKAVFFLAFLYDSSNFSKETCFFTVRGIIYKKERNIFHDAL